MFNQERYNRNILINQIKEEGQKALLSSKILVAGAGGLGSTVLANIASVGIGNIGIIDNDVIELSNLNRQYIHKFENIGRDKVESAKEWIKSFNPDINVEIYHLRLDENNHKDIIKDYNLIIDCFDSYKSKFLLNKIAVENNKTLIHGGVTEFFGQVTTIIPGKTACLNCLFPDADLNTYAIKGVISPAVTTIASIQSMEAVKILLNIGNTLENKLLTYNGLNMEFKKFNIEKNANCPLCNKNKYCNNQIINKC
ncbi:MAG: HesA/MoeB/ThiF family protein [Candidatus Gastranaerophilaceae bacterium]|jgi:adenylyltransferase/sulfurtransferase